MYRYGYDSRVVLAVAVGVGVGAEMSLDNLPT